MRTVVYSIRIRKVIKEMMEEIRDVNWQEELRKLVEEAVADAAIISNFCDGTVFVTSSRKTHRDVAKESIKELKLSGANIIGGVLTRVQKRDTYYGMDYYYYGD